MPLFVWRSAARSCWISSLKTNSWQWIRISKIYTISGLINFALSFKSARFTCMLPPFLLCKSQILDEIEEHGIKIYHLPDAESDEDEDFKEQTRLLKVWIRCIFSECSDGFKTKYRTWPLLRPWVSYCSSVPRLPYLEDSGYNDIFFPTSFFDSFKLKTLCTYYQYMQCWEE